MIEQLHFKLIARSEINVSAFRSGWYVTFAVPKQACGAEPGSGGYQSAVADLRFSVIQCHELFRPQLRDSVGRRLKIVYKGDRCETEPLGEHLRRYNPGQIGRDRTALDDRAGDAKAAGGH